MKKSKLILCVCGAGINTSSNAKMAIKDYLEKVGVYDIDVRHVTIGELSNYRNRKNMIVVWMTQVDETFEAPYFQGLPYLIGSKKTKEILTREIVEKMKEIYRGEI